MPVELVCIEEHFPTRIQISRKESPTKVRLFVVLKKIENGRLVTSLQYTHVFEDLVEKTEGMNGRSKKPSDELGLDFGRKSGSAGFVFTASGSTYMNPAHTSKSF